MKTIKLLIFSHSRMSRPETIAAAIPDGELREEGGDPAATRAINSQVFRYPLLAQTRWLQILLACGINRRTHDPYAPYESLCKEASA